MSVTKTGWIIAAATAAAFAAGCAGQGQGHGDVAGASCAGEPASATVMHSCKNMAECKAKVAKHHNRHHVEKTKVEKTEKTDVDTTTTAKEEGDAAK